MVLGTNVTPNLSLNSGSLLLAEQHKARDLGTQSLGFLICKMEIPLVSDSEFLRITVTWYT